MTDQWILHDLKVDLSQTKSRLEHAVASNQSQIANFTRQLQQYHQEKESWNYERRSLLDHLKGMTQERDDAVSRAEVEKASHVQELQLVKKQLRETNVLVEELQQENRQLESDAQIHGLEWKHQLASLTAGKAAAQFRIDELNRKVASLNSELLLVESTPIQATETWDNDQLRAEVELIRRELSRLYSTV